jgi:DNA-binding response OmpR family regulator
MHVAETWHAPDWFASSGEADAGLRIVIVDGTAAQERCLLQATRAAGIDCPWGHWSEGSRGSAALLFELRSVPAALRCLRELRADLQFAALPALCSVSLDQLPQLPTLSGFDDFVLQPCTPLELRTRIRIIEQRRRACLSPAPVASVEPAPDSPLERELTADGIHVDAISHEVLVEGRTIRLTAREFALFAYLRARRGQVLSRQHLLERVWGRRYRGGPRTVDTHVGRLRLKFGAALPIETVRSNGYRLRTDAPAAAALDAALPSADPPGAPAEWAARELSAHESAAE